MSGNEEELYKKIEALEKELKALKVKQNKLEDEKNKKDIFFASMIHEIRTPLGGILGLSELMLDGELNFNQKDNMRDIRMSGELLRTLVNDLLDFSKLEANKLSIKKNNFDLEQLINNAHNIVKFKLEEKGLGFNVDIDENIAKIVNGDNLRISQILINLLNNAIKFTDEGGVFVKVTQLPILNQSKQLLEFRVIDTGMGLTKSQIKKIFETFAQAEEDTSHKHGGTGLGLTICKQLTEAMGGEIWVESEVGEGSQFIFTIEFDYIQESNNQNSLILEDNSEKKDKLKNRLKVLKNKKILLVEDDLISQLIVNSFLGQTSIKILIAKNGDEALNIMQKIGESIDLILMDIRLPGMSGYAVTQKIRTKFKKLPIISFSANRKDEEKDKAIHVGMNDSITKPINIIYFYILLLKYLEK